MLDWASGTDPKERIRFIAQLMTTVETEREAKAVVKAAARIKRRQRKPKYQEEEAKEAKKKKLTLTEPAPCEPEHVRIQPWWKRFDRSDVVAIDTEYVEKKKLDPKTNKYLNQRTGEFVARSVAVVDSKGRCLLNKCVKHPKWSFFVDKHTKRANGFEPHSLMNGEDFMKNQEEFAALLQDKLVTVCGGNFIDFTCLGLEPGNYEKFNLHQFFYRTFYSSRCKVDLNAKLSIPVL
ncbi:unnamed protein product [Allacma fusca]|uniref:Uncharacterized protein n=1 Tax=Allacma fusca TaxID=39272 RepID=A0A8J2LCU3_9HEXA|nr:unnamed protein product [Allacma fusca]